MGNQDLLCEEAQGRFKTARRKKRLVKRDRDKQLIHLSKKQNELWTKRGDLPLIPLTQPYQRGWTRSFVLREDMARTNEAEFYQGILKRINTEQFSHLKTFKVKKKRLGKKVFVTKPQYLRTLCEHEWLCAKKPLTEREKVHFTKQEVWYEQSKKWTTEFYFNEPWRFVLKVKPNMITHTKMIDAVLESEIRVLDNHIINHHLDERIFRLTKGRRRSWKAYQKEQGREQYKSPITNKPLRQLLEELD